jgi:hypothetical protein
MARWQEVLGNKCVGYLRTVKNVINISRQYSTSSCDRELKREAAVIRHCPSFITKLLVAKFIVTYWGIKLAMAWGCRTGPPAYVA